MISFNPFWDGQDYHQASPAYDGFAISYLPGIAGDAAAAQIQLANDPSFQFYTHSAEALYDGGIVYSGII